MWLVLNACATVNHLNAFEFQQGGKPQGLPYEPGSYASETRYDAPTLGYNDPPKTGGEAQSYYNPHA